MIDPIVGGAMVGAAGSIAGGYMGKRATERANNANIAMQNEFAKNGIRWKVEDAKAAGVHPLYALGAQTSMPTASVMADNSLGQSLANASQDISAAMMKTETQEQRARNLLEMMEINSRIEENDARRDLTREQIRRLQNIGPTIDMPKISPTGAVKIQPDEQISSRDNDHALSASPGTPAFKRYNIFGDFGIDAPWSQEGLAESLEGTGGLAITLLRNLLLRPAEWFNQRAFPKLKNKYSETIRKSPNYYRFNRQDSLYSSPSR